MALIIAEVVRSIGEYMGAKVHACVGGTSVKDDIKSLEKGVHIVVGTPGRIQDMIKKKILKIEHLKILVMDETDELF